MKSPSSLHGSVAWWPHLSAEKFHYYKTYNNFAHILRVHPHTIHILQPLLLMVLRYLKTFFFWRMYRRTCREQTLKLLQSHRPHQLCTKFRGRDTWRLRPAAVRTCCLFQTSAVRLHCLERRVFRFNIWTIHRVESCRLLTRTKLLNFYGIVVAPSAVVPSAPFNVRRILGKWKKKFAFRVIRDWLNPTKTPEEDLGDLENGHSYSINIYCKWFNSKEIPLDQEAVAEEGSSSDITVSGSGKVLTHVTLFENRVAGSIPDEVIF
jgi:hypothetical protein